MRGMFPYLFQFSESEQCVDPAFAETRIFLWPLYLLTFSAAR
jgi:hypothetical protein